MFKRVSGMLLIAALAFPGVSGVQAQPRTQPAPNLSTAVDPRTKIHPELLAQVENALRAGNNARRSGTTSLNFMARVQAGTDLSAYAEKVFVRPFVNPDGSTVAVGQASAASILKIAAVGTVIEVQPPDLVAEAPAPPDPEAVGLNEPANISTVRNAPPAQQPTPPDSDGWFHTGAKVHRSQQAWAKGYTGNGVKVMINDSGADYCHPDLINTYAYVEDTSSPYYGLPYMFDSFSTYAAARDYYLGETNIAAGVADYADTSTVVSGATASFQPIGAPAALTYKLPSTSKSGKYHIGSHPDKAIASSAAVISGALGDGKAVAGERAGVLVVDATNSGVYNTVIVDLNYNHDFTDDKPAVLDRQFKYNETACLDYTGDGLNDISGGLVYYIADGKSGVPTHDWYWGIPGSFYGNGNLVAFHVMDFTAGGGDHGQGCTSVAVGQGVVVGSIYAGPDGPPQAGGQGLVVGPGKNVKTVQNGDAYLTLRTFIEDGFIFAAVGLDGVAGTADDIQISSNSWGFSEVDNDGWDRDSRLIDLINRALGPNLAILNSTGNGAAGYGTTSHPGPASSIDVGASTQYDSIGIFEPVASEDQIVAGDVMSWSNRGPGSTGTTGVDVVATGAFGTGDVPLNSVFDGAISTGEFGGTSMSTPVAAGNLALIYQAWKERNGSWPTFEAARAVLQSSARNVDHDVFSQGSGLVDADRGTDVAAGKGGFFAFPVEWRVGSYRGTEYESFAHIINRGTSDTQEFSLYNQSNTPVKASLRSQYFIRSWTKDLSFTSKDVSLDHGSFTTPDYVFRIDKDLPKDTALMQVRLAKPYNQFDPNDDQAEPFSNWQVLVYNWTDLNGDGKYWTDTNGNGKVDVGEMQLGEYVRFTYGYNQGPTQQARVSDPLARKATGILIGVRHNGRIASVPKTKLKLEVAAFKQTDWPWAKIDKGSLTIPANGSASFKVKLSVPFSASYGMHEGAILVKQDGRETVIPVVAAVTPRANKFGLGRADVIDSKITPYENHEVYGYTDYSWRNESGDWRFYFADITGSSLPQTGNNYLVVDNKWNDKGTDIDTIVLGPTADCFSNGVDCDVFSTFPGAPSIYGPYTLGEKNRSTNTYLGSGRWGYNTSSGGAREIVAAPVTDGLHEILFHQVKVGGSLNTALETKVGIANLSISDIVATGASGTATVKVNSDIRFLGFKAQGYGLSTPKVTKETVKQDDPNDPSTASFRTTVEIKRGALLEVSTGGAPSSDIDLYVYGPDGSIAAASTTASDEEKVSIQFPADGTYTIVVHGYDVPAGTTTFDLGVNAVQGGDLQVTSTTDNVGYGDPATVKVKWNLTGKAPGTYYGLVLAGPRDAPGLFEIPVTITIP